MRPPARLQVLARLRDSASLLRAHPWVSLGLGAALILSLAGVCCGLGLVAAPWFICEMFAVQLREATGARVPHRWSWLGAVLLQAVSVVVIMVAAWLAITWIGPQPPLGEVVGGGGSEADVRTVLLASGGGMVALLYLVPFLFAPIVLVERGGTIGGALIDSASLVSGGGLLPHLRLSLVAHVLQLAPALAAGAIALELADRSAIPPTVLGALPFMAVTLPLGQGMVVSAYAVRRDELPQDERAARTEGSSPPWWVTLGVGAVTVAPAIALVLVAASLVVRPSHPEPGRASGGEVVAEAQVDGDGTVVHVPTTTLQVRASPGRLAVAAGDGGGAGRIPHPPGAQLDAVRVVRERDTYVVEMRDGHRSWVTRVDRAGVRLDDDLSTRLADHLPARGLLLLVLAMLAAPALVVWAVPPFGALRRMAALPQDLGPEREQVHGRRRAAFRRAIITIAVLAPIDVAALVYAAAALG